MLNRLFTFLLYLLGILLAIEVLLFAFKIVGKDIVIPDCTGQCIRQPHDKDHY